MLKSFLKNNGFFIGVLFIVLGTVIALNALFPYSGDDWYWATRDFSIASLTEANGRYLGSALSMVITRFKWLRVVLCTAITLAVIYLASLNGSGRRAFYFAVAAALFMAMPLTMLSEVLTWASGFANYMPSALAVIAYVALVGGEFSSEPPVYRKATPYLAAALGVVVALFMETVTIGNIIVGAAVLIYRFIRFKKPSATLIAFLGGAIVGAVLMFSNDTYYDIFLGDGDQDYDRDVLSLSGVWDSYIQDFYVPFAFDNLWLNLALTGSFVWLFIKNFVGLSTRTRVAAIICFFFQAAFLLESGSSYFGGGIVPAFRYEGAVKGLLTFFFFAAAAVEVVLLLKDVNVKLKGIFLIGAILAYSVPLLFVTPVGPRNFTASYVLFIALTLTVLNEDMKGYAEGGKAELSLMSVFLAALFAAGIFYIAKYSVIFSAYTAREEAVRAVTSDDEELIIDRLPVYEYVGKKELCYVHNADPEGAPYFLNMFRQFYDLSDDLIVSLR